MFLVDSNILIYAANNQDPAQQKCLNLLHAWRQQAAAWCVTWGVCYEFLRVTTHPRVFRSPLSSGSAWSFLRELLASPRTALLTPTDRHPAVLAQTLNESPDVAGNRMHDLHTAVLMRENGVRRIITRDAHFHRFKFLEPVDPLLQ